jgi:hypothetical protein
MPTHDFPKPCRSVCPGAGEPTIEPSLPHLVGQETMTQERAEKERDLLFRMARHIRNTEGLAPNNWGIVGMGLLAELRALDVKLYEEMVK